MKSLSMIAAMLIAAAFCQTASAQQVVYVVIERCPQQAAQQVVTSPQVVYLEEVIEEPRPVRTVRRVRQTAQPAASQRVVYANEVIVEQPEVWTGQRMVQQTSAPMTTMVSGQQFVGDAVNQELIDYGNAIRSLNQSYVIPGRSNGRAWTGSSGFIDGMGFGPSYRLHDNGYNPPHWHQVDGIRRGYIPSPPGGRYRIQ